MEYPTGVLEAPVTMEQGMDIRIGLYRPVKGFEYQGIVIVFPNHIGHNTPVIEIQDGTKIDLVYLNTIVPLELRHISQPFLVGLVRMELAVQDVLSGILGILGGYGTAMIAVLDGGLDVPDPADPEDPLVTYMDPMVMLQFVPDPPVALIRAFLMNLFYLFRNLLVFRSSVAQFAGCPFVVCAAGYMQQLTPKLNGKTLLGIVFPDRSVEMALSYLPEASLLTISSNFFSRPISPSARYSLCLSCSISIWAFSNSVLGV